MCFLIYVKSSFWSENLTTFFDILQKYPYTNL